ncbi:GBD/FH3 domain-containing protein [Entamoeba marina]
MKPVPVTIITDIINTPPKTLQYEINPVLVLEELIYDVCVNLSIEDGDQYALYMDDLPLTPTTLTKIKPRTALKLSYALDYSARVTYDQLSKATNAEMTMTVYVGEFARLGGIQLVLENILKYEGNVQSYGLTLLRSAMSFDSGMQEVVQNEQNIQFLYELIDISVLAAVCRQALELLFVAVHYGGFKPVWAAIKKRANERNEISLQNIVQLLKSGDIETVGNALTFLYGILHIAPSDKKYTIRMKLKYLGVHKEIKSLKDSHKQLKDQILLLEKYFYSDEEKGRLKTLQSENSGKTRKIELVKSEIERINQKIPIFEDEKAKSTQTVNELEEEVSPLRSSIVRPDIIRALKTMSDVDIQLEWVKYNVMLRHTLAEKANLSSEVANKNESRSSGSFCFISKISPKTSKNRKTNSPRKIDSVEFHQPSLPPTPDITRIPWRRLLINPNTPTIWSEKKQIKNIFSTTTTGSTSNILDLSRRLPLTILFTKIPNESRFYEAISHLYKNVFSLPSLYLLQRSVPTDAEARLITITPNLVVPEILLRRVVKTNNLDGKISAWITITSTDSELNSASTKLSELRGAIRSLRKSTSFKDFIGTISSYNNDLHIYDNSIGFDVTSLIALKSMKTQRGDTLLDDALKTLSNVKLLANDLAGCKLASNINLSVLVENVGQCATDLASLKGDDDAVIAEISRAKTKAMEILADAENIKTEFMSLVAWCLGKSDAVKNYDTKTFFGLISTFHAHVLTSKTLGKVSAFGNMKKFQNNQHPGADLFAEIIDKIRTGEIGVSMLKKTRSGN